MNQKNLKTNQKATAKTWANVKLKYNTEQKCEKLFLTHLWPDGIKCPKCGQFNQITNKIHANKQKTCVEFKCPHCGKKITEKIDCIFTGSPISFSHWLDAIYYVAIKDKSTASRGLVEALGITQNTAWKLIMRISQLAEQDIKLSGEVEIDEWYENGIPQYKHNYQQSIYGSDKGIVGESTAIFGMVQRPIKSIDENGKIQITQNSKIAAIVLDIHGKRSVECKTTLDLVDEFTMGPSKTILYSDKAKIYESKAFKEKYTVRMIPHNITKRTKIRHDEKFVQGDVYTNNVEGLFSQLSKYLRGTHNKTTFKHTQKYIDMFCFRWNNKDLTTEEKIHKYLSKLPYVPHSKIKEIVGNEPTGRISKEIRFFTKFHDTLVSNLEKAPVEDVKHRNDFLEIAKKSCDNLMKPGTETAEKIRFLPQALKKFTIALAIPSKQQITNNEFYENFIQECRDLPWEEGYSVISKNLELRMAVGKIIYANKQLPNENLRLKRRKYSQTYNEKQKLKRQEQKKNANEKFDFFPNKPLSSEQKQGMVIV